LHESDVLLSKYMKRIVRSQIVWSCVLTYVHYSLPVCIRWWQETYKPTHTCSLHHLY